MVEFPECDTDSSNTDVEDVSDIPNPSQDLEDSTNDGSTDDTGTSGTDSTEGDEEFEKAVTYFFDDAQSFTVCRYIRTLQHLVLVWLMTT